MLKNLKSWGLMSVTYEKTSVNGSKSQILFIDIETTGLNAWYGDKVTCICAKTLDNSLNFKKCDEDEFKLLACFSGWLKNFDETTLLVHANGKEFDIPFLCARACLIFNENDFAKKILNFRKQFDLCTDITFGEWGKISLNKLAKIYNVPQKIAKGTDAIRWFAQKEFKLIEEYCWADVLTTEAVYLKFLELKRGDESAKDKNRTC